MVNDGSGYKVELTFEFQRLTQSDLDALEGIYRRREPLLCIPDSIDAPEEVYVVQWVSGFDWQDTVKTDWSQGKSLKVVFESV